MVALIIGDYVSNSGYNYISSFCVSLFLLLTVFLHK